VRHGSARRFPQSAGRSNAILNDPGPLSIHDREMEERLSHCLLLLLQAEMPAPPVRGSRGRKKQLRRSQV
jgi:hypothetical protein